MPNDYIDQVKLTDNTVVDIKDTVSGYITAAGAPVQSVNGQMGAVLLSIPSTASDVGAIAAPSSASNGQFLKYNGTNWIADNPNVVVLDGTLGVNPTTVTITGKTYLDIYNLISSGKYVIISVDIGTGVEKRYPLIEFCGVSGGTYSIEAFEIVTIDGSPAILSLSGESNSGSTNVVLSGEYTIVQEQITASGILKGNGSGTITAAVAGTDYGGIIRRWT